jgi:hypothetical protein
MILAVYGVGHQLDRQNEDDLKPCNLNRYDEVVSPMDDLRKGLSKWGYSVK